MQERDSTPAAARNDQVALDMKLYTRDEIDEMDGLLKGLLEVLLKLMEDNLHTYMPGLYPPSEGAAGNTRRHHVGAYYEMFPP